MKHNPSFFECTAGERRGLIVLSVLMLLLTGLRVALNFLPPEPLPPLDEAEYRQYLDFEQRQQFLDDSLETVWAARRESWKRHPSSGHRFPSRKAYVPEYGELPARDSVRPALAYPKKRGISAEKLELNAADSLLLRTVPGIGAKVAREIVRYRERLGGFVSLDQLLEVRYMDSTRYLQVVSYLSVDTLRLRKIDVNRADIAELRRHPYIDYYLAKTIVLQRERSGHYTSLEQLRTATRVYPELYARLRPYLKVK